MELKGLYITDQKIIAKTYLKRSFIIDVLSCVPTLVTNNNVLWLYVFKVLRVAKFGKLLKFQQRLLEFAHYTYSQ